MMALTQENVHYGVMNKSNRVHARIQEFCQAGEGGSRPDGQKTVWTMFFLVINLLYIKFTEWIQWFYYRGEEGAQLLPGGVQRNPYNL